MNYAFTSWDSELYHHGVKGQKWGIRRYQNPDGSLTEEGLKRYTGSPKAVKRGWNSLNRAYAKENAKKTYYGLRAQSSLQKRANYVQSFDEQRKKAKDKYGVDTSDKALLQKAFKSAKKSENRAADFIERQLNSNRELSRIDNAHFSLYSATVDKYKNVKMRDVVYFRTYRGEETATLLKKIKAN